MAQVAFKHLILIHALALVVSEQAVAQFVLRELPANGINTFTLKVPDSLSADRTWILPDSDGSSGQVLTTNGAGILSWAGSAAGGPPIGSVQAMMTANCPSGYLETNGATVSRTTYATLFASLGVIYGAGDGSTTFNLPDLRGYFMRGWDHGAARDPDRASRTNRGDGTTGDNVGTKQPDQFRSHTHGYSAPTAYGTGGSQDMVNTAFTSGNTVAAGGNETRPANINVLYCIKY